MKALRWLAIAIAFSAISSWSQAQRADAAIYRPEQIEWTWEVRPEAVNPKLPNVLLVGDSISRNYFPEVQHDLKGVANVYLFSSSICVGDPRLEVELAEFQKMEGVRFRVIHFNNGLHGWKYTEKEYKAAFPIYLKAIRNLSPMAALIWASSTPMRKPTESDASNARVVARNKIAFALVHRAGIAVDNQYALMLKHQDLYQDDVHFNKVGSDLQGDQAAQLIRESLH
jgi:hypothetical protein